jgi:hypothetical protein
VLQRIRFRSIHCPRERVIDTVQRVEASSNTLHSKTFTTHFHTFKMYSIHNTLASTHAPTLVSCASKTNKTNKYRTYPYQVQFPKDAFANATHPSIPFHSLPLIMFRATITIPQAPKQPVLLVQMNESSPAVRSPISGLSEENDGGEETDDQA